MSPGGYSAFASRFAIVPSCVSGTLLKTNVPLLRSKAAQGHSRRDIFRKIVGSGIFAG